MDERRQRLYRTAGIVLQRQDFGEADRILTLFTPEHGKLRVIAKGVRRLTSRKKGHLEPFTYSSLLIARGRDLDIVTQAETIRSFRELREDLVRLTYASYVAELVNRFTEEQDENRPLFDLLLRTLEGLTQAKDLRLVARYFEMHLLEAVGYRPELHHCVVCHATIQPVDNVFSFEGGGVVCPDCIPGPHGENGAREPASPRGASRDAMWPLPLNLLKVMRFLQRESYPACQALRLQATTHTALERLMHGYIVYLLEREVKSVAFLETLRREWATQRSGNHMKG